MFSSLSNLEQRFWSKVVKTNSCWNWTAAKNEKGYGLFGIKHGKIIRAHRFSYELVNGKIPTGLTLDHLCRNRACVNPDHLEAVTNKENILRGIGLTAINSRKTHCPKGHPYSSDNLVKMSSSERKCKTCYDERKSTNKIQTSIYNKSHYQKRKQKERL